MATPNSEPQPRQSMHERIMADPEARAMYFRPNDGFLRTSPHHQDADRIVEVLNDHNLCYLHERDTSYPRPRFYWQGNISIGLDEITAAAETICAGRLAPTLVDMSDFSPYEDLDGAPLKGPLAEYAAFYDDYDEEPTEAERAAAVEEFLADAGRFPGVGDSLDRARQAEIDADYPGETPPRSGPTRREPASIEI